MARDSATASASSAAIAGAVAGDLVKIRFQLQQAPISSSHHGRAKYVSLLQSVRSIHGEEGIRSFWRGNLAATKLWVAYASIQFSSYRALNAAWTDDMRTNHKTLVSSVNGACAGVIATVVTYPLDLFRTIFASQGVPKQFPTLSSLARHMISTRGVRGLYSGVGPALFQIAPYMGLSFGIYSSLNGAIADHNASIHAEPPRPGSPVWLLSFIGTGAVAGLLSKMAVYPLDTVKKRMQMREMTRCETYGVIPNYETSRDDEF
ncbi:hypothetical protein ATCC90586_004158 [Pythium insidiosum]|nr:hypothetical protein ATCC90586_004158 [Pythium insidiosum]